MQVRQVKCMCSTWKLTTFNAKRWKLTLVASLSQSATTLFVWSMFVVMQSITRVLSWFFKLLSFSCKQYYHRSRHHIQQVLLLMAILFSCHFWACVVCQHCPTCDMLFSLSNTTVKIIQLFLAIFYLPGYSNLPIWYLATTMQLQQLEQWRYNKRVREWRSNLSEQMVRDHPVCLHVVPPTDSWSWKSSDFLHHDVDQTQADRMTEVDVLQPGN